jgi:hypothetical protein
VTGPAEGQGRLPLDGDASEAVDQAAAGDVGETVDQSKNRRQHFDGLSCHESVCDKDVAKALLMGQYGGFIGVFKENGRFRVGIADAFAPMIQRLPNHRFGGCKRAGNLMSFRRKLRDAGVLTMPAGKVAAGGRDGVGQGPRKEVEEGFFLNRVHVSRDQFPVGQGVQGAVPVFPDMAEPVIPWRDPAFMGAKAATDRSVRTFFPESRLFHAVSFSFRLGGIQS